MSQENVEIVRQHLRQTHADARGGIKRYGPPQSSADMMSEDAKFALGF
jgi:hypothetical protein